MNRINLKESLELIITEAYFNAINNYYKNILIFAVESGHKDIVKLLLNKDTSIDIQDKFGGAVIFIYLIAKAYNLYN